MSLIRLQFVLGASFSSRAIAWWGNGYDGFSHVDAVMDDGQLIGARSDVINGMPAGVRMRAPNYEKWKRQVVVTFPGSEAIFPEWDDWLRKQIGCGYDKGDILGLIFGIELMQEGHWICSALQNEALERVKLFKPCPIPTQQITPNSLFLMACEAGGVRDDMLKSAA